MLRLRVCQMLQEKYLRAAQQLSQAELEIPSRKASKSSGEVLAGRTAALPSRAGDPFKKGQQVEHPVDW
jgi:hypothetical protein